jgi:type I restriction enzyme S subunit
MVSEWEEASLSELSVDISYGYTESANTEKVGPHFLRITDIQNGIVDWKTVPFCPIASSKLEQYRLKTGDIVVARTGNSTGENYIFTGSSETVYASYLIRFKIDSEKADPFYVWYNMRSPRWWGFIDSSKTGSAQAGANAKVLGMFPLSLPPLPEQKAIAHVLGALDDRIELNRRMNETLESMAQALFKSWFVDFDPVIDNALASGKEIPEELSDRAKARAALGDKRQPLPEEIRTLFPNEFTASAELGWIPEVWEVASYSKYAVLNQSSWTKKNSPESVQYVDLANTKNGKINLVVPYAFSDAPSRARRILNKHDTIIGTVRPGNRSFAYIHNDGLTGSTGFAVMSPKEKSYRSFVYLGLTRNEVIDNFAHLADGAAYPAIRPDVVANTEFVFPSSDLLQAFDSVVYPWIAKAGKQDKQAEALSELRDTLLPKLLSGEVRIQEAEKMVEGLTL